MFAAYLTRGVKAGLVAGVVLALFVGLVANPLVVHADETNHAAGEGHSHDGDAHDAGAHETGAHDAGAHGESGHSESGHEDSAVSATADQVVSVLSSGLWAVLLGGVVFGIGFYVLEPAVPGTGATKSFALGAAGFVTVSGAPWLVLPPVPPGAEQSLSVDTRILWYAGMMAAGAVCCLLSGYVYGRVSSAGGPRLAGVAALAPFALLAIPTAVAPTNAVDGALGPDLRAGLFGLVVFGQVLVWLTLAASHALLGANDESRSPRSTAGSDAAVPAD